MENYKQNFIQMSIDIGALKFGEFELKSGRVSPYFFNMGLFSSGRSMKNIGDFYAAALEESNLENDMLFGPAYKGVPLVSVLSSSLFVNHEKDVSFVYNRKEKKEHGEGAELEHKASSSSTDKTQGAENNPEKPSSNCSNTSKKDEQSSSGFGQAVTSELMRKYKESKEPREVPEPDT